MASSSRERNLDEAYANLSLNSDEEDGLILEDIPGNEGQEGMERCLVGKFVSTRKVNFMAMQDTLSSIWRPVKGVFMEETDQTNMFLFKFFHDRDMQRVLDDGPWTFNQQVLVIKKFNAEEQLKDIILSELFMWVQVYDVPIGFKSEFVLKSIGNFVGRYMESDPKNFQGLFRDYLRVRVAIDISRPLKSQMRIKKPGGEWLWIHFKYERLPSFCFYCGKIGHSEKFCEELFDNPQAQGVRKYDSSLRASPRNQASHKGNQWIRGADGTVPIAAKKHDTERNAESMEIHREESSGKHAQDDRNPKKSGDVDKSGAHSGGNVYKVVNVEEPKNSDILNDRREKEFVEIETAGLSILDPKRRRVDDPITEKPNINFSTEDDIMTESRIDGKNDPKNVEKAGSVTGARLAL
ncbi:hypothetical protein DCAR_0521281 [Daucus carota subsp. sativus]|uniref:CCHC-type domain-containing protein n=1 Tax=Daucus carota subsp. sativus TaxID=79200 RepID=A0AAF1B0V1_DAUCS|nr:hypothetical protein DCAR_0521281 [Daucus carota subsp. sativus]